MYPGTGPLMVEGIPAHQSDRVVVLLHTAAGDHPVVHPPQEEAEVMAAGLQVLLQDPEDNYLIKCINLYYSIPKNGMSGLVL